MEKDQVSVGHLCVVSGYRVIAYWHWGLFSLSWQVVFHKCHPLSLHVLYSLCIHLENLCCSLNTYLASESV